MPNKKSLTASIARTAGLATLAVFLPSQVSAGEGWKGLAKTPQYKGEVFPPWQKGENNDAVNRGFDFTVPEVNSLADFHGDLTHPQLVLYVGGNYFFAMAPLIKAFEQEHQEYKGKIFWETIPPGLDRKSVV